MNIVQWLFPNIFLCEENHDYNKDKIEFKSNKDIEMPSKNALIPTINKSYYYNNYSGISVYTTNIAISI